APGAARSAATARALEALPAGGSVLDVGCGGGAAAFALTPPASLVIGVDERAAMLELFAQDARRRGVEHRTVLGSWPAAAPDAPRADVAVCHNVAYNVAELAPFVIALDAHARRRVVLELTLTHPWAPLGPLFERFWGLSRPAGPTAELALAVVHEAGFPAARLERSPATPRRRVRDRATVVAFTRRRLCLGAERDPEVDAALGEQALPELERAAIWWEAQGGG
ncbi:MAG: methyltransferase domain-containing protein, partial [Acidimicrobiales bacterium]